MRCYSVHGFLKSVNTNYMLNNLQNAHHSNDQTENPCESPSDSSYSIYIKGHSAVNHRLSNLQDRALWELPSKPTAGKMHTQTQPLCMGKLKFPRPTQGTHPPNSSRLGTLQKHTGKSCSHLHIGTRSCGGGFSS